MRRLIWVVSFMMILIGNALAQSPEDKLLEAIASGNAAVVASLINEGVDLDINARNERSETALLVATHANNVEIARILISAGADVNAKDDIQDSAYLFAGARGHLEILKLTLANGADVRSLNRYGGTALIPAAERGHIENVKALINVGVDVNHINNLGWTALLEAIILGDGSAKYTEIVKVLLEGGSDMSIADKGGVTPLQHARANGYAEIVDLLLEYQSK